MKRTPLLIERYQPLVDIAVTSLAGPKDIVTAWDFYIGLTPVWDQLEEDFRMEFCWYFTLSIVNPLAGQGDLTTVQSQKTAPPPPQQRVIDMIVGKCLMELRIEYARVMTLPS